MSVAAATPSQPSGWIIREGRTFRLRPLSGNVPRLWLTSLTILFVELMLIRWVPAEIRYIGFFSNFLLMASFLGIGLGILLGRKGARWSLIAFPLLLLGVVVVVTSNQLDLEVQGGSSEIWFGLTDAARDAADTGVTATIPLVATKGRASYLGERSAGHADPGATSAALLLGALADAAAAA